MNEQPRSVPATARDANFTSVLNRLAKLEWKMSIIEKNEDYFKKEEIKKESKSEKKG